MARKKKIDKEMGFRLKNWQKNPAFPHAISRKSKIMETCQALKS